MLIDEMVDVVLNFESCRFGGQITPAMAAVAKKHKLDPSWLGDPTNVTLLDGNAALDAEKARLQAAVSLTTFTFWTCADRRIS